MVALKYSIMVNGVTQLIMMKSDVMNDFDTIRVATAYEIGGRTTSEFPYEITGDLRPVYTEFEAGNATCAGTAATRSSPRRSNATWSSSSGRRASP